MIRRANYSFELKNNKLRIFPIPDGTIPYFTVEYISVVDRFGSAIASGSANSMVSDYSNAPYTNMLYKNINDVGKRWIRKYTLALCKEMLGNIRAKYDSIPIPNGQLVMDGIRLRDESAREKELLWDQLRESLEESGRTRQAEKMAQTQEYNKMIISDVPLGIYIG